jgi:hypothetical protein
MGVDKYTDHMQLVQACCLAAATTSICRIHVAPISHPDTLQLVLQLFEHSSA